jgi:hypothetical protein
VEDSLLTERLRRAILTPSHDLADLAYRDVLVTLLDLYDLHLAPIERLGGAEEWQHEPRMARLKGRLETVFRARLDEASGEAVAAPTVDDVVAEFRRIARADLVPPVYDWIAERADLDDLVDFLSLEGGPDADFDDLVALCQVGLVGEPKLTLGANYWDEMGRGDLDAVHTELHRDMAQALELRACSIEELPVAALERKALGGLLATNRALQPEMLGGLGLLECQAGPRCRRVVAALERLDVARGAFPFYEEHAVADPRHGKEWVDHAIAPLVARQPTWGARILRGARWRSAVNGHFFSAMAERFGCALERAA